MLTNGTCTCRFQRSYPCPSPALGVNAARRVVCEAQRSGFGADEERQGGAGPAKKKKGKRGKISSRPSPKEQLKKLQEDERLYKEQMEQRYSSTNVARADFDKSDMQDSYPDVSDDSAATVPEQITDRMLKRIAIFSGGPIALGMLLFPLFYYVKKVQGVDLPVWAVYIVQTSVFGGGLLGISYGIISSSWDPQREGSFLGWNEFQTNLPLILNRFKKK